jgi:hypothetical protein
VTAPDHGAVDAALADYEAQVASAVAAGASALDAAVAALAVANARIVELEGEIPPSTLFGDTPRTGSNPTGIAAIDAQYGVPDVMRLFWSKGAGPLPVNDGRRIVGSIKVIDGNTKPWADQVWRWTYQHEIDSKIARKLITLGEWKPSMQQLAALDTTGLSVILTADCFVNPKKDPADYLIPGVPRLGVDFDGISQSGGYHDYSRELAAVEAHAKKYGLTWGVGEFGANRAANDTDGSQRAKWLLDWARRFADAGAEYVCLWEQNGQHGSDFDTPAETAAVRQLLHPLR